MSPLRILLVEDNLADVDLLLECLAPASGEIALQVAHDGETAIKYLNGVPAFSPHIIILDLNLPGLSGHEVLGLIKSDERLRRTPVVVLTHSEAARDIERAYELGANCYLTKPGTFEGFRHMVQQLESFWLRLVRLPAETTVS